MEVHVEGLTGAGKTRSCAERSWPVTSSTETVAFIALHRRNTYDIFVALEG